MNTELWRVVGNDSTFVDRPIPFLRTRVDSEQLVMRTTPYNESPITAFLISPARRMPLSHRGCLRLDPVGVSPPLSGTMTNDAIGYG